jgi:hypothetical protein
VEQSPLEKPTVTQPNQEKTYKIRENAQFSTLGSIILKQLYLKCLVFIKTFSFLREDMLRAPSYLQACMCSNDL